MYKEIVTTVTNMINFLKETLEKLCRNGKKPEDVRFIKMRSAWCTWEQFDKIASREYDNGYGTDIINSALMVVGDDWWMERHEYDGSEWWEFKRMPAKPDGSTVLTAEHIFYDPCSSSEIE